MRIMRILALIFFSSADAVQVHVVVAVDAADKTLQSNGNPSPRTGEEQKSTRGRNQSMLEWPRFSGDDCVKQKRADQAQCIPCKKTLPDGSKVDRFRGNCKRDATVLASQLFTPWHNCEEGGACKQGRLPKFRGQLCWAFNKGNFTPFDGPAGVCIKKSWRSRHIPTVDYALANMGHGVNGRTNTADFVAAYQWSMEQRRDWGDRPETVMTCQLFCKGLRACGEVGDCTCGEACGENGDGSPGDPPQATTTTQIATTTALTTTTVEDRSKCLERGHKDDDCCALASEAGCADGYTYATGAVCAWSRRPRRTYYTTICFK